jgi:hypothetical protein
MLRVKDVGPFVALTFRDTAGDIPRRGVELLEDERRGIPGIGPESEDDSLSSSNVFI